jgi:hypothetical protein
MKNITFAEPAMSFRISLKPQANVLAEDLAANPKDYFKNQAF